MTTQPEQFERLRHPGDVIRILTPPHQIPIAFDQLVCYTLFEPVSLEKIDGIFKTLPQYPINKRFFTGKNLCIQDTFQMFADNANLYIKT